LDTKLARPEIRQLLQRITFSEYLGPMASGTVGDYLRHRLARAALSEHTDLDVFEAEAVRHIAATSAGVPRLVNILAHKCLMLAYGEGVHRVEHGACEVGGSGYTRADKAPAGTCPLVALVTWRSFPPKHCGADCR